MRVKTYLPKVIHISGDKPDEYLCGIKKDGSSWHNRCLNDKFAKTLPLCERCSELTDLVYKAAIKK